MPLAFTLAERGWLPDSILRFGIRRMLAARAQEAEYEQHCGLDQEFRASLAESPVAIATDRANEQHYELPPAYFQTVLGPHLKYSSCLYPIGDESLERAEAAMLALTCEHAELADGQQILELGCGWGSLTLWMAERYPHAQITAVSNSAPQRAHIEAQCQARNLGNVTVITADMNTFDPGSRFDRIVSVEMFEHIRNWPELLRRVRTWLVDDGRVFIHVFCHATTASSYDDESGDNWMSRHFFSGGMMPAFDLLYECDADLQVDESWRINGAHYARTLESWLEKHDANRKTVLALFRETYGPDEAKLWFQRWRLFYIACAEFFGFRGGDTWFVAHYRLRPRQD